MADKFYVALKEHPDTSSSAEKDSWLLYRSGPHPDFAAARTDAHDRAKSTPGVVYMIIQVKSFVVADLVRDIEP